MSIDHAERIAMLPPQQRATITNNYGQMDVVLQTARTLHSEYVVSIITGRPEHDKSYWLEILNQSDVMYHEFDARLHTLAEVVAKTLSKRTDDKFGRGMPYVTLLVQSLAMGAATGSEKFAYLVGGQVIPYEA